MKNWRTLLIVFVPAVILVVIGFFLYSHRRRATVHPETAQQKMQKSVTTEQAKLPKKPNIDSVKAAQQLVGTDVWMQYGYVYRYFPYRHDRVDYGHAQGPMPSLQKMKIEKIVTQRKPRRVKTKVPGGREQVLAVFTMPGSTDTYALPIGYTQGKKQEFFARQMLFFNNPRQVYSYWPDSAWASIEKHEAAEGMSELQVQAALGMSHKTKIGKKGERIVTYQTGKKKWTVTFRGDKAVAVKHS